MGFHLYRLHNILGNPSRRRNFPFSEQVFFTVLLEFYDLIPVLGTQSILSTRLILTEESMLILYLVTFISYALVRINLSLRLVRGAWAWGGPGPSG